MSHFYGTVQGSRGEASRTGGKDAGITAVAAGWGGAVKVRVFHDADNNADRFSVQQTTWRNGRGLYEPIAEGVIGKPSSVSELRAALTEAKEALADAVGLIEHKGANPKMQQRAIERVEAALANHCF